MTLSRGVKVGPTLAPEYPLWGAASVHCSRAATLVTTLRLSLGEALRIAMQVTAALASLAVAGCQSAAEGVNVFPTITPSLEGSAVLSNDPNRLGRTHLAAGNYAMAERHFRDAVEKNKKDGDSWIALAAAYDNLGRFDLADRAYQQAITLRGETLEIVNNRGYSYMLRGDGPRALAHFEKGLALDPENAVIANNIKLLQLGQRHVRNTPL